MVADLQRLSDLLAEVEVMRESHRRLRVGMPALDLDILCSVVDAHLEEQRDRAHCAALTATPRSVTATARLRLVVAALLYLVDADDAVPDSHALGLGDDVLVLWWAARMALAELPVA